MAKGKYKHRAHGALCRSTIRNGSNKVTTYMSTTYSAGSKKTAGQAISRTSKQIYNSILMHIEDLGGLIVDRNVEGKVTSAMLPDEIVDNTS